MAESGFSGPFEPRFPTDVSSRAIRPRPTADRHPRGVTSRREKHQGLICVSADQALFFVAGAGFEPATSGL